MALQTLTVNQPKTGALNGADQEDDFDIELQEDQEDLLEEELEEELDEDSDDEEDDDETEDEEAAEEDDEEFEDAVDSDEEDEVETETRENDRIRSLIEANKIREADLLKMKEENKAIKKRYVELQKSTKETSMTLLKNSIDSIKVQMAKAQEDGDINEIVNLQEKLSKVQADIRTLENWNPHEEDEKEEKTKAGPKSLEEAPEAARTWISKNPWFRTPVTPQDQKRVREAVAYAEILASEGYSFETEEFYRLVDSRLEKLGLAPKQKSKVKLKNNKSSSEQGRKTVKKKISQTVQGASRSPGTSSDSKKKVVLTAEQQRIADLYGMTNKEYAEEILKIEKAKTGGKRMTPLNV